MRTVAWPELLRLSERRAGEEYLSIGNRAHLPWVLIGSALAAAVVVTVQIVDKQWLRGLPWVAVLVLSCGLFVVRERPFFQRRSDDFQLAQLLVLLIATVASLSSATGVLIFAGFGYSAFLVLIRWSGWRLLTFGGALLAAVGGAALLPVEEESVAMFVISPISIVILAGVGWRITRRRLAGFQVEYRRQAGVERDRARMSEELSDARAVQLSMLPRATPELPWLEVASASLPATEVGGDYYDFLVLDEDRLAVIIGDVAGHGMASGLVLAGVRSGLYLLRDELDRGVEVLSKLDAMLRDTSPERMFVTLQIALLDRRRRSVAVANAGHPPLLVVSGSSVEAVGAPGTPLGTRLDPTYRTEVQELAPGDNLVLFTDGLSEVRNYRGESFDGDRLEAEILRAVGQPTVQAARDRLLARISHFKGDVEQEDDVTLVILRLAGG